MKKETRLRGRPKAFLPKKDQTKIQSLDRAVDVMECVPEFVGFGDFGAVFLLDFRGSVLRRAL